MVPSTKLPGAVQRDLEEALRSAFSTPGALRRMVQHGLGENLYSIAATENLTTAVFELVNWAQEHGQLEELIVAALKENRSNPALCAFAWEHGIGERPAGPGETKPARGASAPAASRARGRSPYRTHPRSVFSPEQVEGLEKRIDQGDLPGVLTALHQAAVNGGDGDLRDFVIHAQDALGGGDHGTASLEERRLVHARWGELARVEIRQREGSAPLPTRPMLHCARLSRRWWRLNSPLASWVRWCARTLGREPPEAYRQSFSLPAVNLDLWHGKIAGVVGSNGTGKTTLLRMLALDLAPSDGELEVCDESSIHQLLTTKVTMVPQAVPRWQGTLLTHLRQQGAFFGFTRERKNREEVDAAVDLLGLKSHLDMRWDELSGGYRTRAAIAAALVARPGLLVLDEPLAMLDPRAQQKLLRALRDRATHGTTAIVVSSQHVPEIESIADVMIALTPGEPRAEIEWSIDPKPTGHLFELGVRGPDDELRPRLRQLEEDHVIAGFVPGVRSAVVWFEGEQTILGAVEALEERDPEGSGLDVYQARDLTGSMVSRQYADLAKGRPRSGAGEPEPVRTAETPGAPPPGAASGGAT